MKDAKSRGEPELPFARHQMRKVSDADRVEYLKRFTPPEHILGMEMFVRKYAPEGAVSSRARQVMMLIALEAWHTAIRWVLDEYGPEGQEQEQEQEATGGSQEESGEEGSGAGKARPDGTEPQDGEKAGEHAGRTDSESGDEAQQSVEGAEQAANADGESGKENSGD